MRLTVNEDDSGSNPLLPANLDAPLDQLAGVAALRTWNVKSSNLSGRTIIWGISSKEERLSYIQKTRVRYLHPLPIFTAVSTMVVRQAYTLEGPD